MGTPRRIFPIASLATGLLFPMGAGAAPGVYDDCVNLHARKIVFDVNAHLVADGQSCPLGGPTLDPDCLEDCSTDAIAFGAPSHVEDVPTTAGCDGLTANQCALAHFADPIAHLTGETNKAFEYRLVPLCEDGTGSHEWELDPAVDTPACLPADYLTCADGTRAVYWAAPGTPGSNEWIFRFSGGHGGCGKLLGLSAAESCWDTLQAGAAASGFRAKRTRAEVGLLGNAGFPDANRVYIHPCGEDRYTGDNVLLDQAIGANDSIDRLALVGSRIVTAVFHDLVGGAVLGDAQQTQMPDLSAATRVVLAGSSAGAIGLSFLLDQHAATIAALSPGAVVEGLLDSRLMPSLDNEEADFELSGNGASIYGGMSFDVPPAGTSTAASAFTFSEMGYRPGGDEFERYGPDSWNTPVHDDCWTVHGPSGDGETWRCRDQAHLVFNHVATPVFVAHSLRDSNQTDAPIEWADTLEIWELEGDAYCDRQRAQLDDYARLRATLADGAAAAAGQVGVWAANFSWHEFIKDSCALNGVRLFDGTLDLSLKEAFAAWQAGQEIVLIDGIAGARTEFGGCSEKTGPLTCRAPHAIPALSPLAAGLLAVLLLAAAVARLRTRRA